MVLVVHNIRRSAFTDNGLLQALKSHNACRNSVGH